MNKQLFIGADIGTTNIKVVAYDKNVHEVQSATRGYQTSFPTPDSAEQEAEDWWNGFCSALKEITQEQERAQIASISVSSHVPSWARANGCCTPFGIYYDRARRYRKH